MLPVHIDKFIAISYIFDFNRLLCPYKNLTASYNFSGSDLKMIISISHKINSYFLDFQDEDFLLADITFRFKYKKYERDKVIPLQGDFKKKTLFMLQGSLNLNYSFFMTHFELDLFTLEKDLCGFVDYFIDEVNEIKNFQVLENGL